MLDKVVGDFPGFVVFNPIVNGIGGNLASVQASRTATMLHSTSVMGVLSDRSPMCVSPIKALFHGGECWTLTLTLRSARPAVQRLACLSSLQCPPPSPRES